MSGERTVIDLVFRSASGKSLSQQSPGISSEELRHYSASDSTKETAVRLLRQMGFEIVGAPSSFGVTISGPSELVREVFGTAEPKIPEALTPYVESARIPPPVKFFSGS